MSEERFARALAAIDAANAEDPHSLDVRGETRPKELAHAELVSEWIAKLAPDASDELRLAGRAHHLRRWTIPRSEYPDGRVGYLTWRRALQDQHARETREILSECGYSEAEMQRVDDLLHKRGLGRDPEVQVLEDALCLVFLETQFRELAERLEEAKLLELTAKTLRKMSEDAVARAFEMPLDPRDIELIQRAARLH